MKRPVFYVAHPVGGDVPANVSRCLRWYRHLTLTCPRERFVIPWLPDVLAFDDSNPSDRAAGFDRNMEALDDVDGIILVGGRISAGMKVELDAAESRGLTIESLIHLGPEPPAVGAATR